MYPDLIIVPLVTFAAGLIRGFTGFGGPAFILATLTWLYSPAVIVGKILIIEFIASCYLVVQLRKDIVWRTSLAIAIPTLISMPLGYWILEHTDPQLMRKLIAGVIFFSCILMVIGLRYERRLNVVASICLGLAGGVIFGASFIALLVVAVILMGPYTKSETRGLLISWGFLTAVWFYVISIVGGTTSWEHLIDALPAAASYFAGVWIGSRYSNRASEGVYRQVAIYTLIGLSVLGFTL